MILSKAIAVLVAAFLSGSHRGIGGIGLVQSSPVTDADIALVEEEINGGSMGMSNDLLGVSPVMFSLSFMLAQNSFQWIKFDRFRFFHCKSYSRSY